MLFHLKIRRILRCVIEPDDTFHLKMRRGDVIEVEDGHAVTKQVMDPANGGRFGSNVQAAIQKTLIKTIARTKHQPVFAEAHRLPIAVFGLMLDDEDGHADHLAQLGEEP